MFIVQLYSCLTIPSNTPTLTTHPVGFRYFGELAYKACVPTQSRMWSSLSSPNFSFRYPGKSLCFR